jgi:hypothetical protein
MGCLVVLGLVSCLDIGLLFVLYWQGRTTAGRLVVVAASWRCLSMRVDLSLVAGCADGSLRNSDTGGSPTAEI